MWLKNVVLSMLVLSLGVTVCNTASESVRKYNESIKSENNTTIGGTAYSIDRNGSIIDWSDTGFSYFLDKNGNVMLSYGKEEVVKAPLVLSQDINYEGPNTWNTGFYISETKTAIAYEAPESGHLKVMISDDKGQSWNNVNVDFDNTAAAATCIKIGFTNDYNGWMVVGSFVGMGHEDHYIYTSSDGGKTWTAVDGNINDVYSRVMSGAAFMNSNLGFLCFRYEFVEFSPAVCITRDGGLTWSKADIQLPMGYDDYSQTPLSPASDGVSIILPIILTDINGEEKTIYMKSKDEGITWTLEFQM